MSLTESKAIDKIEIVGMGVLQVRQATTIMRDGVEIAKTYQRWCFEPSDDVGAMPANVQAIAAAAWTSEVVSAFQAHKQAELAKMGAQA